MSSIQQQTQPIRHILATVIGETTVKSFFSYYAMFKDGAMFGLYKAGKFYLRISPAAFKHTPWVQTLEHLEDYQIGIHNKHFYHLPDEMIPNITNYQHLLTETIQEINFIKQQNAQHRKKLIRTLPNLNISIERLLRRLGIKTVEDFIEKGAINTFVEMIKIGIDADQTLLFKLCCALEHRYIYTLTHKEKVAILKEANEALYNSGLRRRFRFIE